MPLLIFGIVSQEKKTSVSSFPKMLRCDLHAHRYKDIDVHVDDFFFLYIFIILYLSDFVRRTNDTSVCFSHYDINVLVFTYLG